MIGECIVFGLVIVFVCLRLGVSIFLVLSFG